MKKSLVDKPCQLHEPQADDRGGRREAGDTLKF